MSNNLFVPLAARLRPTHIDQVLGQEHLLGPDKPLRQSIESGRLHSMIFWGPPGTGKTTIAHLVANAFDAHVEKVSAVLSGVKEIRSAIASAKERQNAGQRTVLFVDEVHRFNKAQQDAFLPHVEDGTVIFIGATTENPSFELNNALLSRARVYVLKQIRPECLEQLIHFALEKQNTDRVTDLTLEPEVIQVMAKYANGDARRAINLLEVAVDLDNDQNSISLESLKPLLNGNLSVFDKKGDVFYELISALHKSVRGSNPDAALYWFARMIKGGCDPHYIARRVVRMASEDIGNADPRGLQMAVNAWETFERLGSPEGELAIAQAIIYLASAPKSNAAYKAYKLALADAEKYPNAEVPVHLRNAPTQLMKALDYGKDYRYAHDESDAVAYGEKYFPKPLGEQVYYEPVERGLEIKIAEKLRKIRQKVTR